MKVITTVQRYFGVEFLFLSADPARSKQLSGNVALGAGTCVLHIQSDSGLYLIDSIERGGWYEGRNADLKADSVTAKWARMGNEFVGVWREDETEWLFSFRLPPADEAG